MASHAEWACGYARQARADFETFQKLQTLLVPECHKLQFLQMACEKLVKSYLCENRNQLSSLQSSHAYVKSHLPTILRHYAVLINFKGSAVADLMKHVKHFAEEIETLAPAVERGGRRLDNCEYPWEDNSGALHVPLDWSFASTQLLLLWHGRTVLKLIQGAIERQLP